MVEIKKARYDDGKNVRVIQTGELVHRAAGGGEEGRGRREGESRRASDPFFSRSLILEVVLPEAGFQPLRERFPRSNPTRK